jgi:hypothetical protein
MSSAVSPSPRPLSGSLLATLEMLQVTGGEFASLAFTATEIATSL